jgi:hypothetical protein
VVWVKQLVHVVGAVVLLFVLFSFWLLLLPAACRFVVDPCLEAGGGEEGRLAVTDE